MDPARLAAISLFAALSDAELTAIAEKASELEVAPGHAIAKEGDFGHALYAIESGTAEVARDGRPVRVLGPGDVFGEIALLASGRRTATVVATAPLRLIVLFKRDVWALEQHAPSAADRLQALISERELGTTAAPAPMSAPAHD
jgi:CPA1 family monovalent cation:H+ antiporter